MSGVTWYEALLWLGGGATAIAAVAKILLPAVNAVKDRLHKIDEMAKHDKEQYLAILRLTVMSTEMPISERLIAGKKYIEDGGNGDVAAYYKQLLEKHTR